MPMDYYLPPGIRVIAQHPISSSSGPGPRHNRFTHPHPVRHLSHYPQWNNALCYNGPTYYVAPAMYTTFPLPLGANTAENIGHAIPIPSPDLPYSTMKTGSANEHEQHEETQ